MGELRLKKVLKERNNFTRLKEMMINTKICVWVQDSPLILRGLFQLGMF